MAGTTLFQGYSGPAGKPSPAADRARLRRYAAETMILTPIGAESLPRMLTAFAAHCRDPFASAVFRRIADPAQLHRADGASAARHQAAALDLARSFGMAVLPGSPQLDFGWNGQALRGDTEAYVLLHEIAHFQLAPPERRHCIDFGLGAGPESGARAAAERAALLFGVAREREEAMASLLGILWEVALEQPALASFLDQNWLEGAERPAAAAHFETVLSALSDCGLVDAQGTPQRRLRADAALLPSDGCCPNM
jgi:hypothetical protein